MSVKEIRELAHFCYFDLTVEDIKKLQKAVDGLPRGDPSGVQHSFSSEGGVAIPYVKLGLPKDFGEWLHLRFYERLKFRRDQEKTWHMAFIFYIDKGLHGIAHNKIAKEAVLTGMKRLLEFVEKATEKPRAPQPH